MQRIKIKCNARFYYLAIAISMAFLGTSCRETNVAKLSKPNILLIMADDQGWGDVGVHDNEIINTPTLDSLSGISVRFDRFYVSPVCAPTRASLLTGRYHLNTGVSWVTKRLEVMRENEVTLAELLKVNGYRTGIFGKWHNGSQYPHDPTGQGFDTFYGFSEGHLNNYFDTRLIRNRQYEQTTGYVPDLITNEAIDFMAEDRPFFCYLAFNTPHSPFQVPDAYFDKYKLKGLDDRTAAIYGMVENMDDNIQRVLQALETQGKGRETIVIFLSDNGPSGVRYNGNFKGTKAHVDEGGVRVPFFIHFPAGGIQNKSISEKFFGAHIDVLPTLAELTGISIPDSLEIHGRSLMPLLQGVDPVTWKDRYFFTHQVNRKLDTLPGAIRTNQYTLTLKPTDTAFYDILIDPYQKHNIATQFPEKVETYVSEYHHWFRSAIAKGMEPELIQVGHKAIAEIILPAQECAIHGGLKYQGGDGWANDWLVDWKTPSDSAIWNINAVITQRYTLIVNGSASARAKFVLTIDNEVYPLEIKSAMLATVVPDRDKFPRTEVAEKVWKEVSAIEVEIQKGYHTIKLHPLTVSGNVEIKEIHLRKISE